MDPLALGLNVTFKRAFIYSWLYLGISGFYFPPAGLSSGKTESLDIFNISANIYLMLSSKYLKAHLRQNIYQ